MNKEGGVSVFLLLIKSNERITSQFIDEIEEFSELYFEEKEELWKRTVVVFTTIDELKGCDSYEDRVNKLETQIAKPGMEKVKNVLDQTNSKCIYVSSIDNSDKQRVVNDLNDRLHSTEPRESQISDPNSFSKEICKSLQIMDIQNEVKSITTDSEPSPIVDKSLPQQPPDHISDQVSDPPTKPILHYSQTNNGIISQNSQYPDQKSSELEKSIDTQRELPTGSEHKMSMENKHQHVASHSLNDTPHGSALNCKSSIKQILPRDDKAPKRTPESSHISFTHPPSSKNLQSQHVHSQSQEQNQNTYDDIITKIYPTAYSKTKDSLHTNLDPKVCSIDNLLKSLGTEYFREYFSDKHHDDRSHSGDEENEIPVRNRICMFESITRFTDDIMKGGQNINHPVVHITTSKEKKQPNKYGDDEHRQNTTSHPVHNQHCLRSIMITSLFLSKH